MRRKAREQAVYRVPEPYRSERGAARKEGLLRRVARWLGLAK